MRGPRGTVALLVVVILVSVVGVAVGAGGPGVDGGSALAADPGDGAPAASLAGFSGGANPVCPVCGHAALEEATGAQYADSSASVTLQPDGSGRWTVEVTVAESSSPPGEAAVAAATRSITAEHAFSGRATEISATIEGRTVTIAYTDPAFASRTAPLGTLTVEYFYTEGADGWLIWRTIDRLRIALPSGTTPVATGSAGRAVGGDLVVSSPATTREATSERYTVTSAGAATVAGPLLADLGRFSTVAAGPQRSPGIGATLVFLALVATVLAALIVPIYAIVCAVVLRFVDGAADRRVVAPTDALPADGTRRRLAVGGVALLALVALLQIGTEVVLALGVLVGLYAAVVLAGRVRSRDWRGVGLAAGLGLGAQTAAFAVVGSPLGPDGSLVFLGMVGALVAAIPLLVLGAFLDARLWSPAAA